MSRRRRRLTCRDAQRAVGMASRRGWIVSFIVRPEPVAGRPPQARGFSPLRLSGDRRARMQDRIRSSLGEVI
jgi:hypothetical protein